MARRVEGFQFVKPSRKKYPWDKWTDGAPWEVVHGKDFTCTPGSLVVYLYHKARELDDVKRVKTSIIRGVGKKRDRVMFQFIKNEPAKKKLKRKAA